jgi:hypothetical protein
MSWAEIEAKWTAMTRRVRSDQGVATDATGITDTPEQSSKLQDKGSEMRAPPPLDRLEN